MRLQSCTGTTVDHKMTPEDYEARRDFVEAMKGMGKSEFIEIARILRRHGVAISENRSGLYFDMTKVDNNAFEALLEFRAFVASNNAELEKSRSATA
jgi:hypothetical protein